MKKGIVLIIIPLIFFVMAIAGHLLKNKAVDDTKAAYNAGIEKQVQIIDKARNAILQKMPIYEDYTSAAKEAELRKYLLNDHLKAANDAGVQPVSSDENLSLRIKEGQLVSGDTDGNKLYYYFNVPKKYRYYTKNTLAGLEELSQRFQKVLREKAPDLPNVKFAISSATRPMTYQQNLRNSNANASFISSHSYAMSFDIFYDSFFVDLPLAQVEGDEAVLKEFRRKAGFLLGESKRRQLRAMLVETLLQMQREGRLYAIWERNQRCYHVTILAPL